MCDVTSYYTVIAVVSTFFKTVRTKIYQTDPFKMENLHDATFTRFAWRSIINKVFTLQVFDQRDIFLICTSSKKFKQTTLHLSFQQNTL
jgi:hypothetical protein